MSKPIIRNGRFTPGADLRCGENVVIDVAEEVVVGDRCVLPDNSYFGGRRVEIGDDFYGTSWGHPVLRPHGHFPAGACDPVGRWLEIGRGRIDEEQAVLKIGARCTLHDNRIDLARSVTLGDDVGLSPEVVIYTHGYWLSPLERFPCRYAPVVVGSRTIVGFRTVLLPGVLLGKGTVIGAQSVVTAGRYRGDRTYAGNPARIRSGRYRSDRIPLTRTQKELIVGDLLADYLRSLEYRGLPYPTWKLSYPLVQIFGCCFDVEKLTVIGDQDDGSDDFRDFCFKRGLRFYTERPFRKLGRMVT